MRRCGTTICCSALALTTAFLHLAVAQPATVSPLPARQVWTLALNNALTAPPGFGGTHGYFPIEGERLVAYDLSSGTQLWLASARPTWSPLGADGRVFVADADGIIALDARDGTVSWRLALDEQLAVAPVAGNGWLIAATVSGAVLAVRGADGQVIWRHAAGTRASGPPAVAADRLYVPVADGRLLTLQLGDGSPIWERRLGGPATAVLALDDRLYAGATDNYLYCLEADDGEIAWRWRTGADVIGTPVVDDERVYFVSLDNILRGLDRGGGSQEWKRALPTRPRSGPLLVGGTLIVGGLSPAVRGYAADTGQPAGDVSLPSDLTAPPYVLVSGGLPLIIAVVSDILKGAMVMAFSPGGGLPAPFAPLPDPPAQPALTLP